MSVNPNQLANNVPIVLSNAITAKEKGIGKAFIVLAAEAAERFQRGGGAAARQYTAYSGRLNILALKPHLLSLKLLCKQHQLTQIKVLQLRVILAPTAEQLAYAQQMLSMQANQTPQ